VLAVVAGQHQRVCILDLDGAHQQQVAGRFFAYSQSDHALTLV
jgi:hypothetical protein